MGLTVAWGPSRLFSLSNGRAILGCAFEILPSGTMLQACGILRGVLGQPARCISATKVEILDGGLVLAGILGTECTALLPHRESLIQAYLTAEHGCRDRFAAE